MIYQLIVLAVIAVFTTNMAVSLRAIRLPAAKIPALVGTPLVSILVPARNEAANIADCVNSLRAQDYPSFEVLVLDDESTDGTADIVAAIAARDDRVRLLRGAPLPEGWAGKPHACWQLSRVARGDYLLFTDADTTHAPQMLRTVLPIAQHSKASLVSGYPRQVVGTLLEKASIPVVFFLLLVALPPQVVRLREWRPFSFTNGQFLLFPRSEYERIGGHESVKARIMEDVFLGLEVRKKRGRQVMLNLSSIVSCRMYRDHASLWEGFVKWGYSFSALSPVATLVAGLCLVIGFSSPFISTAVALFLLQQHGMQVLVLALVQVGIILLARFACDRALGEPAVCSLLTPLGIVFFLLAMLYGTALRLAGRQVHWKRRSYGGNMAVT